MMKKRIFLATLILLLFPALGTAQSAFNGTWKFKLDNAQFAKKPEVYLLRNGTYACKTCVPPITVKADGRDHAVTGHPYFDSMAVKVVDDHTIEQTNKKNGKVVGTSRTSVSDGFSFPGRATFVIVASFPERDRSYPHELQCTFPFSGNRSEPHFGQNIGETIRPGGRAIKTLRAQSFE